MTYGFKKGKEAKEYVEQKDNDFSKQLLKLKSGDEPVMVKLPSDDEYAYYEAHSAHKVFFTTPCTKMAGEVDLYDKASELLYKDFEAKVEELKASGMSEDDARKDPAAKAISDDAYTLKAKGRYMIGFFSLDTGEQVIVDVTENQGKEVVKQIEKYASKKDKIAFELYKSGSSTKTTVNLAPVLDMDDDLTDKQRKTFDKLVEDQPKFDDEVYGKIFAPRDHDGQVEDLRKFGFDLSRLGIEPQEKREAAKPIDETENPESQF